MYGMRGGNVRHDDGRSIKFELPRVYRRPSLVHHWHYGMLGLRCGNVRHNDWSVDQLKLLSLCGRPVLLNDRE